MWKVENVQKQGHRLVINIFNATQDEKKEEESNEHLKVHDKGGYSPT